MNKKVSIITVVWNAAAELDATLASLVALDYPAVEIIVIDGASTDETPRIIEKYRDKIAYSISEPDKGLYDAMNKGIIAATGDYLWFVNAGDKPFSNDILTKIFNQDFTKGKNDGKDNSKDQNNTNDKGQDDINDQSQIEVDIYFGETMICDGNGKHLGLRSKKLPEILSWKSLQRGMVVCHQSFIVRRAIAPLYDLRYQYVADIDWVIKCLKAAKNIHNTGLVISEFATGGISTRNRRASLKERFRVMVKHYGWITTIAAHARFIIESPRSKKLRKI